MPDATGWHQPLQPPTYTRRCFRCGWPLRPAPNDRGVGWIAANGNARCDHNPTPHARDGRHSKYGQHEPAHDMPDPDDTAAMEQWLARED